MLPMATFIKDKESGELTLYEDVVFYLPGLTSWGKVLLVTFKSRVQKLLSACENRNGTPVLEGLDVHRGQTYEHAREIERGSHRSIRKTLHVAVTTATSSCEFEAKFSFYFNEVQRR